MSKASKNIKAQLTRPFWDQQKAESFDTAHMSYAVYNVVLESETNEIFGTYG